MLDEEEKNIDMVELGAEDLSAEETRKKEEKHYQKQMVGGFRTEVFVRKYGGK